MIDHDRLFKELLTEFFGDFVDLFLPELAGYLDKASLVFLDKEIFTDVTAGATHEADLVVRARFCGQDSFFLVHLEHQAQAQRDFGRRMFRYFARLHDKHAMPVYPIVLFSHGSNRPEPDHYEVAFPDLAVLQFRYRVIQLALLNWRDYLRRGNPVASALMARMGMAIEERPRVKLECLRLLATLRLNPARMRLISGFVDTYLRLNAQETLLFREQTVILEEKEKHMYKELTTSWKEEGMLEESQQIVFRLLRRRWGELPPRMVAQVQALPVQEVENLAEALWDFTSLADVEKWLGGERTPPKS